MLAYKAPMQFRKVELQHCTWKSIQGIRVTQ